MPPVSLVDSKPLSKHSMAQAMVTPALMVSIPRSSQMAAARMTVFGSSTPHNGPKAKRLSYSMRPLDFLPLSLVTKIFSQPMVQLAQLAFLAKCS